MCWNRVLNHFMAIILVKLMMNCHLISRSAFFRLRIETWTHKFVDLVISFDAARSHLLLFFYDEHNLVPRRKQRKKSMANWPRIFSKSNLDWNFNLIFKWHGIFLCSRRPPFPLRFCIISSHKWAANWSRFCSVWGERILPHSSTHRKPEAEEKLKYLI